MPEIPIHNITASSDIQSRETIQQATVDEYAEAMVEGVKFPEVIIYDDGTTKLLADGFHRYFAALKAGVKALAADVRRGGLPEAIMAAASANITHGLRRSNADKQRAVRLALDQNPKWSDRRVATHCGVSRSLVASVREALNTCTPEEKPVDTLGKTGRVGKDGKTRKAVSKRQGKTEQAKQDATAGDEADADDTSSSVDPAGYPITDGVSEAIFALVPSYRKAEALLQEVRGLVDDIATHVGGELIAEGCIQSAGKLRLPDLENVLQAIKREQPYVRCPHCFGTKKKSCEACAGLQWLTKTAWKQVPKDIRDRLE